MGFKAVKNSVLNALQSGSYQHESRGDIDAKNLLQLGQVSAADIKTIIHRCKGQHYESRPHHADSSIEVHILKRDGWYIKFYFLDPDTIFISVHQ